ncbi:UNKNOWN [Stylonychia lemnae]|uniref:Surface protein Sur1 n=1 Tax=Stylonychia lemnae TaxID=5949 RepID=A0A078ATS6_STYLE|nr:UNKNOWN [Stylonychia lemnae]|eukprot:CDW84632.1 UNKNOWN [Stylonychia lemnae]
MKLQILLPLIFSIISTVNSGAITSEDNIFEQVFADPQMKPLRNIFEYGWLILNQLEFCLFPKEQTWNYSYFHQFLRQYGLNQENLDDALDTVKLQEKPLVKFQEPRIPRKTHRVWITHSLNPTECHDSVKNPQLFEEILNTNRVLDQSASINSGKWEHYLWTNDKSAIPKTVKWFEQNGIKVRELRELPSYDLIFDRMIEEYSVGKFAAAADVARMIIMNDEGGLYLDIDSYFASFDDDWLYYFDSIFWKDRLRFDSLVLFNYQFLSKPNHPVSQEYLKLFKISYTNPEHLKKCYIKTKGITLWETGPFIFTIAFILGAQKNGNRDFVMFPQNTNEDQVYSFYDTKSQPIDLKFHGYSIGLGSWIDDYADTLIFGFE